MANLLVMEDGPGLVFEKLRNGLGVKPGRIEGFIPSVFSCVYCMSVWTTAFTFVLWFISPFIVMVIAAMSIALIVDHFSK